MLFGRNKSPEGVQPSNGIGTAVQDPPDPEEVVQPEEITLPEGADVSALYSEDGAPLYVLTDPNTGEDVIDPDTGEPIACDSEGNRIPQTRPEGFEPPAPPEPPAPEPPKSREYTSPFAKGPLSDTQVQKLVSDIGEDNLQALDTYINWRVSRQVAATAQHQAVARDLGISDEEYALVAEDIGVLRAELPVELQGTKNGEIMAFTNALAARAMKNGGNLREVLDSLRPPAPAKPKPQPPPQTPAQRGATPRPGPDIVPRRRDSQPSDVANRSLHVGGLKGDVIATLRAERRTR